jgi:transposase
LAKAEIVHARFHLVKYLNDAVDKVKQIDVKNYSELIKTKYIFLKNTENQTDKQRIKFEEISNANYKANRALTIKENF